VLGVEQWAEIRRMANVERLSQREIHRRTGVHRDTIRRALASLDPPSYGPRPKRPSKLDAFPSTIEELLDEEQVRSARVSLLDEGSGLAGRPPSELPSGQRRARQGERRELPSPRRAAATGLGWEPSGNNCWALVCFLVRSCRLEK
jgi:hypothetical protein